MSSLSAVASLADGTRGSSLREEVTKLWGLVVLELRLGDDLGGEKQDAAVGVLLQRKHLIRVTGQHHPTAGVGLNDGHGNYGTGIAHNGQPFNVGLWAAITWTVTSTTRHAASRFSGQNAIAVIGR